MSKQQLSVRLIVISALMGLTVNTANAKNWLNVVGDRIKYQGFTITHSAESVVVATSDTIDKGFDIVNKAVVDPVVTAAKNQVDGVLHADPDDLNPAQKLERIIFAGVDSLDPKNGNKIVSLKEKMNEQLVTQIENLGQVKEINRLNETPLEDLNEWERAEKTALSAVKIGLDAAMVFGGAEWLKGVTEAGTVAAGEKAAARGAARMGGRLGPEDLSPNLYDPSPAIGTDPVRRGRQRVRFHPLAEEEPDEFSVSVDSSYLYPPTDAGASIITDNALQAEEDALEQIAEDQGASYGIVHATPIAADAATVATLAVQGAASARIPHDIDILAPPRARFPTNASGDECEICNIL